MPRRAWRRHQGLMPQAGKLLWRTGRWLVTRPALWALLLVGLGAGGTGWYVLSRTEAFRLERIETPPDIDFAIPNGLIGRNIWTVDLRQLTDQLKAQRPHLKRVRVIRRLPDTLVIEVLARVPVAQVQLSAGTWHAVDREGVVLPSLGRAPASHLAILKGLHPARLKVGRASAEADLQRAVRMAESLQRAPALIGHRLTSLDVGDEEGLVAVLDETLEVRFGRADQLAEQLPRLRRVLALVQERSLDARYLDVRFEDPVVGQRVAKR